MTFFISLSCSAQGAYNGASKWTVHHTFPIWGYFPSRETVSDLSSIFNLPNKEIVFPFGTQFILQTKCARQYWFSLLMKVDTEPATNIWSFHNDEKHFQNHKKHLPNQKQSAIKLNSNWKHLETWCNHLQVQLYIKSFGTHLRVVVILRWSKNEGWS